MSRNPESATPPAAGAKPAPCDPEQVRLQLEHLLGSPVFRTSKRCQILLRHVTERTLAGDTGALKERSLGVEVFGRPTDYDTNQEPIVRGTAAEIRKKLAQYYQEPQHNGELRISLPLGSYVPEFHTVEAPAGAPHTSTARSLRLPLAIIGAVAVCVVAAVLLFPRGRRSALDQFWGPMLDAQGGVLFCLPQPRVFNFRSDARQKEVEAGLEGQSDASLASSRDMVPMAQLVPMFDRYIAWGDAMCLLRLTSLFEKRGKAYHVRTKSSTSFADLRERPAVLIGAFDNDWTLRAAGQLRFTFYKEYDRFEMVRDRDHPDRTDWKITGAWPHWDIPQDYAIVSRVLDVNTDRMVVIAAGITHFGTMAAGEFLSDPQYFSEVISNLPRDWAKKNLQIVLRVPVVHGSSGHPRVLATHVW